MKQIALAMLCVTLCACGTTSTIRGEQNTDYVLVSMSKAGGAYKLIRGEVTACKISMHGTNPGYAVDFDGKTCEVTANK